MGWNNPLPSKEEFILLAQGVARLVVELIFLYFSGGLVKQIIGMVGGITVGWVICLFLCEIPEIGVSNNIYLNDPLVGHYRGSYG